MSFIEKGRRLDLGLDVSNGIWRSTVHSMLASDHFVRICEHWHRNPQTIMDACQQHGSELGGRALLRG